MESISAPNFSLSDANAPARMSSQDRRQSARIHTGGMRGSQHGHKMPKWLAKCPAGQHGPRFF
jgi:hypothetical protein